MATIELTNNTWEEFSKADYAVIDCYGYNCVACVMLKPVYDGVADELDGISFGRINISEESEIADKFSIDAMPTLLFFRKGVLVNRVVGSMEKEDLMKLMSNLLYE